MSATSEDGVSADDPILAQLNNGSSCVWRTPNCQPKPEQAVETICFSKECGGKLIAVDCTGSGKIHILHMATSFVGGIVFVVIPRKSGWRYRSRVP